MRLIYLYPTQRTRFGIRVAAVTDNGRHVSTVRASKREDALHALGVGNPASVLHYYYRRIVGKPYRLVWAEGPDYHDGLREALRLQKRHHQIAGGVK